MFAILSADFATHTNNLIEVTQVTENTSPVAYLSVNGLQMLWPMGEEWSICNNDFTSSEAWLQLAYT